MAIFNPVQNFGQGLALAGNIQQQQKQNQINALQQGLGQQIQQGGFDPSSSNDLMQLGVLDPVRARATVENFRALSDDRKKAYHEDLQEGLRALESGDGNRFLSVMSDRLNSIEKLKGDPTGTQFLLDKFNEGDINGLITGLKQAEQAGIASGFLPDTENFTRKNKSARMREIESLIANVEEDPEGLTVKGKASAIELGLIAKASKTAAERIAESESLSNKIVAVEAEKVAAKEGAKLKQQLIHQPKITEAVKLAEKAAVERGDVLTSLKRSEAALPGLNEAVTELKELAQISTSTFGGKLFDAAVKQSGFGATKGATAKAKFIAIVNNQVLPLLKETFGAAFTVQEGESLKATMGDPEASTEEKMVQLDAFIAQKLRDIETKQRQLTPDGALQQPTQQATQPQVMRFDAQGNQI